jgi:hypothetical protein
LQRLTCQQGEDKSTFAIVQDLIPGIYTDHSPLSISAFPVD